MPENRFFLDSPFKKGDTAQLTSHDELHHLKVMRKEPGDTLELVNGQNQLAIATLGSLEKRSVHLTINEVKTAPPPSRQLILAQGLLRPKNLDLVIEKGTELGATAFWLFPAHRSEKETLTPNQLERLLHLTISALKQSGRLDLPTIELLPPLEKWPQKPPNAYFGDLNSSSPLILTPKDTTLIIGPEKGFSKEEEAHLRTVATGIRLNPNILRAETAAIAALSIIQSKN